VPLRLSRHEPVATWEFQRALTIRKGEILGPPLRCFLFPKHDLHATGTALLSAGLAHHGRNITGIPAICTGMRSSGAAGRD
jgi:hypothetical protein